jgi:hypothetical protein
MARAGRVLGAGDTVEHDAGTFKVEGVDGRRIRRVRLTPAKAAKSEEQPPRVSVAALLPLAYAPLMLAA